MNNEKNPFRQKFTRIEGLSAIRRLPRLGKIRLGVKKVSAKGKEYPSETKWFVCPPEIRKVYGDEPTELNIMFPLNDTETLFPQSYQWFGSSKGLKCRGDGVSALRLNEDTNVMEERDCPCDLLESGKCKQRASLVFMMPTIKIGGVYQIDFSSYHSIVDINSSLDYALAMLGGRIAMVPFKLRRVPRETHSNGQKQTHYTLQLELDIPLDHAQKIREGENIYLMQKKRYEIEAPPEETNSAHDSKEDGAVIEPETEEEIKAREIKEVEEKENTKKEIEESRAREAQLQKEVASGKHKLKSYQESKAIYKEKKALATEDNKERLDKMFNILNDAGLEGWKEIAYFACMADLVEPGTAIEDVQKLLLEDPEAVEKIINSAKIEEKAEQEINNGDKVS